MDIMQKVMLAIWYGSFILAGLTLGLLISPVHASAALLYDNISSIPSGSSWTASNNNLDGDYFSSTIEARCHVINKQTTNTFIDSIVMVIAPYNSVVYGDRVRIELREMGYSTTTTGSLPLTAYSDWQNLTSLTTSFSTTTFSFTDAVLEADKYYALCFYTDIEETLTSNYIVKAQRVNNATALNDWWLSPDTTNGDYIRMYVDDNDVSLYSGEIYRVRTLVQVYGTSGYTIPTTSSTSSISSVYPPEDTFGVATTSYVNAGTIVTFEDYTEYDDLKVKLECKAFNNNLVEEAWWRTLGEGGLSLVSTTYYSDSLTSACVGVECFSMGVSFPNNDAGWYLQDNTEYICTADFIGVRTFWFDTVLDTEKWRFYTFESSTSSDYLAHQGSVAEALADEEYTGTDSPKVCNVISNDFDFTKCILTPVETAFIPSKPQALSISAEFDYLMETNFPFSVIGEVINVVSSTTENATSTTLNDITLEFDNTSGGTTTLTLLDSSEFTSSWSTIEEFEDIKQIIAWLVVIFYVVWLYNRLKRLVPTSEAIKD